jgi:hypothetical protein
VKNKLIATLVLTGGLALSGAASASAWSWTGTLADWAASGGGTGVVTDGDGDMQFTLFNSTDIPDRPGVNDYITLSEIEIGGKDFYDVGVNWGPSGYAGGGQLVYTLNTVGGGGESIRGATLDSTITGDGTTSLMILYDLPVSAIFDNLSSFNGARDPLSGEVSFDGRSIVGVQQVFKPSDTGVFQDSHAGFLTAVPEPGDLSLAGIGLLMAFLARRRKT